MRSAVNLGILSKVWNSENYCNFVFMPVRDDPDVFVKSPWNILKLFNETRCHFYLLPYYMVVSDGHAFSVPSPC